MPDQLPASTETTRRERYAKAIRDRVRFRFGASVLALAQQGRPLKMNFGEAETAADAAIAVADAEQAELRTQNARMRHELEVMYGGAFDVPPASTSQTAEARFVPPAAEGLPAGALDSATDGASALDAWGRDPNGRNFLAHALVQLARDGWLRTTPDLSEAFDTSDRPRDTPPPQDGA